MGSYNYNLITEVSYTLCDGFHNYNQSLGQLHSVDGFHNYNQSLGQLHSVDGFHNYNQSLGQLHSVDGFHNYNQSLGQLHSVDGFLQLQPITGIKLSLCVMGSTTTTNHWVTLC